jgi:hypothetical protein
MAGRVLEVADMYSSTSYVIRHMNHVKRHAATLYMWTAARHLPLKQESSHPRGQPGLAGWA